MSSSVQRVTRNLSWLAVGEVGIRSGFLMITVLVARGLGASAVGLLTVASGAVMVAVPVLALGQAETLIRECARDPERANLFLSASHRLQRRVELALAPVALIALSVLPASDLRSLLFSLVPYALLRVEIFTRGAAFKGLDRMDVEVKARGWELGIALALTALLAGAGAPVWSIGLALSVGAGVGVLWLSRRSTALSRAGSGDLGAAWAWAHGAPFIGLAVALQLLLRSDVLLAKGLDVSDRSIGWYGASAGLVWGGLAAAQLVALALYPTFSRAAKRGAQSALAALLAVGVGAAIGLAGALVAHVGKGNLLALLFGADFRGGGRFLARLGWALPGASASMVLGVVLAAWRRQTLGLIVQVLAVFASVGLNLVWIPRAGMAGAAGVAVAVHSAVAVALFALALVPRWPWEAQ